MKCPSAPAFRTGTPGASKQADFVRSLDTTRLVTSALPVLFEEMFADPDDMQNCRANMFESATPVPTDPETRPLGQAHPPVLAMRWMWAATTT